MGRQHARVLAGLDGATLVGVCDSSAAARARDAQTFGVPTFERWEDALTLRPAAVVNALPTHLHFSITRTLLEERVHVLVEKPIATDLSEAMELIDVAERNGAVLMVGHTERFNPAVRAVRDYIASARLGEIVSMSARRVGVARPAVPSVGVAIDLAIHDIDVFSHLLGGISGQLVFAAGAALHENPVEDHVDLVLRYGTALGSIQANWITPVKVRRLSVTGTKGLAEIDYLQQAFHVFDSAPDLIEGGPENFFAVSRETKAVEIPVARREPLDAELEEFVAAVRERREPTVPPIDAARALGLAIDATASMHRTSHRLVPQTLA